MRNKTQNNKNLFSERRVIFAVKVANVLLNSHLGSHLMEILMLILEYAQLVSQAILLYPDLYSEKYNDYTKYPLISWAVYGSKVVNPSSLLSFDEDERDLNATVMRIIFAWLVLRYCVCSFLFCCIYLDKKANSILTKVFQLTNITQSRIVYYFASSFFFRAILAHKENGFTFLGGRMARNLIVCIIVILFEFLLGMASKPRLFYVLPTKSLLASKNNTVEIITFLQKVLIQILQVCLSETAIATRWILTSINLIITAIRTWKFGTELPLYKIKGLQIQGILLGIVLSLHLSSLINLILISEETVHEGLRFLVFSWILLSLLSIGIVQHLVRKLILNVLITKDSSSCELLVHKVEIVKQFMKRQMVATKLTQTTNWFYLLMKSINKNIAGIFDLENNFDLFERSKRAHFFVAYLEKLLTKHPQNEFLKLYLAFYYAKKIKNYAKATALNTDLQKDLGSRLYLNTFFLLSEIQGDLRSSYLAHKSQFDLYTYAQSQKVMEKLKSKITKQVDLQFKVCEEILNHNPDLNKIFQNGQAAYKYKKQALKGIKKLMSVIPQYHVSPLVVCAYYSLIVNQSPTDYQKLCEMYNLRTQKYQKYFRKDTLCEENLYQGNCALFVLSGQKNDAGKVVHCTSSVKAVFGGEPEWYIGSKVHNKICTKSLRPMSESFFRSLSETEALALYDQTLRTFLYNKEGFVFETDFYVNTHPSVKNGFMTDLFVRPKIENRDFILVRENGEIEGASRRICKRLGIFQPEGIGKKKFHINQVCSELGKVNEAMNIVSSVDKDKIQYDVAINIKRQMGDNNDAEGLKSILIAEARDTFTLYTEKGNEVALQHVDSHKETESQSQLNYSYFCKASSLVYDSFVLRLFNLEEIENNYESEVSQIIEEVSLMEGEGGEEESQEITTIVQEWNVDEDEKEHGWIDFTLLEPPQGDKKPQIHDEIPARKSEFQANTTKGKMKKNQDITVNTIRMMQKQNNQQTTERNGLIPAPVKIVESVTNSSSSRKSNTMGMSETMKLALETKHNSKTFRGSFLFTIILLAAIIAIVVQLFTNLDSTIASMKLKKDIMVNAQNRGYYIVNVQTITRAIYDEMKGTLVLSDYGKVGQSQARFIYVTRLFLDSLTGSNTRLLHNVTLLDNDLKKMFYQKNVEIIYSDETQLMNGFQAVDVLIQTTLQIIDMAANNEDVSQELFDFLNLNLMNDVLIKNREISQKTVSSVQDEVASMQSLNTRYYIVVSLVTCLLAGFLCLVIWFQFRGDERHLCQLPRLNHENIELMMEQYKNFKLNFLRNEHTPTKISPEIFGVIGLKKRDVYRKSNKSYSNSPSLFELQKRFALYGVKAIILAGLLLIALIFSMVFTSGSIDYLNNKITQISFMDTIATRAAFLTTLTIELPIENGKTLIWGMPAEDVINPNIGYLSADRQTLFTSFMSEDVLENKDIKKLLFADGCDLMSAGLDLYCDIVTSHGYNTSLVQVLGAFETLLIERTNDFENSDRSAAALKKSRLLDYELLYGLKRVMSESGVLIATALDVEFENKLENLNVRKVSGLCSALGSLFAIFVVLWILVMKPMKESDNNFKKVLQIFPARMILSNFPLKIFLLRTSSIDINLKKYFD